MVLFVVVVCVTTSFFVGANVVVDGFVLGRCVTLVVFNLAAVLAAVLRRVVDGVCVVVCTLIGFFGVLDATF